MGTEDCEMNDMFVVFGLICLSVGLMLDFLTALWGFQSAIGQKYRSGNLFIPAVLYLVFIAFSEFTIVVQNRILFALGMIFMHLFAYFIMPSIFDIFFHKNRKQDREEEPEIGKKNRTKISDRQ